MQITFKCFNIKKSKRYHFKDKIFFFLIYFFSFFNFNSKWLKSIFLVKNDDYYSGIQLFMMMNALFYVGRLKMHAMLFLVKISSLKRLANFSFKSQSNSEYAKKNQLSFEKEHFI